MFRVAGGSAEEEARSLHDWLLLDRNVRRSGHIEMASSSPPAPGRQGAAILDLVSLVLGTGINAASLGISIATWRTTRPQQPTVTVERADGSKVTIAGASPHEAQRLLEQLLGEQP
ncbi:hypothetical protein OG548_45785 [Streptomyces sp. NBC_01356]|uniref:effector-associated constant component EACC1 n=1 Tax=Streptomyces sp. NBC_01356 TaxID=2903836 RepID=UPI002E365A31|nr:hypothetical protein [Streptomyces sp. NBC_01356]